MHAVSITTIVKDLTVGTTTRVPFRLNLLIHHEIKSEINSTKTLITARNFTHIFISKLCEMLACVKDIIEQFFLMKLYSSIE